MTSRGFEYWGNTPLLDTEREKRRNTYNDWYLQYSQISLSKEVYHLLQGVIQIENTVP